MISEDNEIADSDLQKAEALSKFFASVFTKESHELLPDIAEKHFDQEITDVVINQEEVSKRLKKLKPNKSMGPGAIF